MGKPALLVLKDGARGLTGREVPVGREHAALIGRLKEYIMDGFVRQGYEGFSPEIDAYYDPFSTYFCVTGAHDELLAALRITEKTEKNALPLEHGLLRDKSSYRLDEAEPVADANSFVVTGPQALPLLFALIARFADRQGIAKGLCLADDDSARFRKIYLSGGFRPSEKYGEPVYFPTFGRTVDGQFRPTWWSVLELDRAAILRHSRAAGDYL